MSGAVATPAGRLGTLLSETRKIPAFVRRDFLVNWSYRFAFFSDWVNLRSRPSFRSGSARSSRRSGTSSSWGHSSPFW